MSDVFYVVSKRNKDDNEYETAHVFNNTQGADNKEAAEEFLADRNSSAPWLSHSVMSADEWEKFTDPEKGAAAPSEPVNPPDNRATDGAANDNGNAVPGDNNPAGNGNV